ncbi:hypothetical protein RIF29_01972 [Crotalaria pallida]|uniref:C2 domain-containing protein n=1 Tax=Crotalaria pallida TaxID=3830 RepID=A0AAN9IYM7_CROPI
MKNTSMLLPGTGTKQEAQRQRDSKSFTNREWMKKRVEEDGRKGFDFGEEAKISEICILVQVHLSDCDMSMDSPQSVVSPFKSSAFSEGEKHSSPLSKDIEVNGKEAVMSNDDEFIGVLDVYVHQARDIHNICIYHKQDVYAKICLTSNPENTVSTKTINGGGRNPVFNENLRVNVGTVESSLKCEIWMLSRVKNYLEDQLLGFALVPLSEVLVQKGKLVKEFSLSSTDLFHSPAGFVQLSLAYTGASPDVMAISTMPAEVVKHVTVQESETSESLSRDLDKIEFPDPKIINEEHLMVSEYFGILCEETRCSDSDAENQSSEAGVRLVECFSACSVESVQPPKVDSPPSSVSTNGVSSPSVPASSESSDASAAAASKSRTSKSPNEIQVSGTIEDKNMDVKDVESDCSNGVQSDSFLKPLVTVNIEPEPKVVQQEIVDMYMKSMQQFTESLAKMKLPMDIASEPTSSGNSSTEQKIQPSKNSNSRVFYGSRAFF